MHILFPLISSLLTSTFLLQVQTLEICSPHFCNPNQKLPIHFPFRVPGNQTFRCGYPGFQLYCNSHGRAILPLPSPSSNLIVRAISYPEQLLLGSDPNNCIPKRVFNFSLSSTPFRYGPHQYPYTFLNCSGTNNTKLDPNLISMRGSVVSCMSEGNYTVVVTYDERGEEEMMKGKEWKCDVIRRLNAAFWWPEMEYGIFMEDLSDVLLELSWDVPNCGDCEVRGGSCGLVGDYGFEVACFLPDSSGLPKAAKYGLILGAGIPGVLCIIGITFFMSRKMSIRYQSTRYISNTESSPSIFPQPIILAMGLDRPTIESYPKTILGESKRLPKPSDNMCPICLSEYEAKETLRSIPDCNHYFHADCIDEWLRMNATCPLCRNSPHQSSALDGC